MDPMSTKSILYWTEQLPRIATGSQTPGPNAFSDLYICIQEMNHPGYSQDTTLISIRSAAQMIFQKFERRLPQKALSDLTQTIQIASSKMRGISSFLEELYRIHQSGTPPFPIFFIQLKVFTDYKLLQDERARRIAQEVYKQSHSLYLKFKDKLSPIEKQALFRALNNISQSKIRDSVEGYTSIGIEQIVFSAMEEAFSHPDLFNKKEIQVEFVTGAVISTEIMDLSLATDRQLRPIYEFCSQFFLRNHFEFEIAAHEIVQRSLHKVFRSILHLEKSPRPTSVSQLNEPGFVTPQKDCPNLEALQRRNFELWEIFLSAIRSEPSIKKQFPQQILEQLLLKLVMDLYPISKDLSFCTKNSELLSHISRDITSILVQAPIHEGSIHIKSIFSVLTNTLDRATKGQYTKIELEGLSPGSATATQMRPFEFTLIGQDLWSHLSQSLLTIMSLELLVNKVNQLLLEKGAQWEPHPTLSNIITLCPPPAGSGFHLQLEEALCNGYLDIACRMISCEKETAHEALHWHLFTIRRYLDRWIVKECKQYNRLVRSCEELFQQDKNQSLDDTYLHVIESCTSIITTLYKAKQSTDYSSIHTKCPCIKEAQRCTDALQEQYLASYIEFTKYAKTLNEHEVPCLSDYASRVACFRKHAAAMPGYGRIAEMQPSLAISKQLHFIEAQRFLAPFEKEFLPLIIEELMSNGERGIASAVCKLIAPGDQQFLTFFLQDIDLIAHIESDSVKDKSSMAPPPAKAESIPKKSKAPLPQHAVQEVKKQPKKKGSKIHIPAPAGHPPAPSPQVHVKKDRGQHRPVTSEAGAPSTLEPVPIAIPREPTVAPKADAPSVKKLVTKASTQKTLPIFDIQRILTQSKGQVHDRVQPDEVQSRMMKKVREACFKSPSGALDFFLHHTYTFKVANIVRTVGQEGVWISSRYPGRTDRRFTCIGEFHAYGKGKSPELGYFAETYFRNKAGAEKLYHHCFHAQTSKYLQSIFEKEHTLFRNDPDLDVDLQSMQSPPTPYELRIYEKLRRGETLFEDTSAIGPSFIEDGRRRLEVRRRRDTIEIHDKVLGVFYRLITARDCP